MEERESAGSNFITEIIDADREAGRHGGRVQTRFPPEPNGFLHIGHAKSIVLNFGLAGRYGGLCNLRFDDTNPIREEQKYVESIMEDLRWLGYDWEDRLFYASDYFGKLSEYAVELIRAGRAYVDDLSAEEIREHRGTLTAPGRESPHRGRSVEENLALFERMKAGEFADGSRTLRAKIDMASGNLNMRDPVMYRILKVPHHRTGDAWCIYPMYDRLVSRRTRRAPSAADRVRPPQPEPHGPQQEKAHAARGGRVRGGLGRPAHAYPLRPEETGVHARGAPRLLRAHRGCEERQRGGRGTP
jgi:glutaminyl-tRNA synthetase